jgi:hypothetical protein
MVLSSHTRAALALTTNQTKTKDMNIEITRELSAGSPVLVQRYGKFTVRRFRNTKTGERCFRIERPDGAKYAVPYDIARLAAGRDAWMRDLLGRCDCGKDFPMHESDVPFCAACQNEAELENEKLNA